MNGSKKGNFLIPISYKEIYQDHEIPLKYRNNYYEAKNKGQ